jgi:hypothetical protein
MKYLKYIAAFFSWWLIDYWRERKARKFKKKLRRAVNHGHIKVVPEKPLYNYHIPPDKVVMVGKFIVAMQKKHPQMSRNRIMRKAAEEFHLEPNLPAPFSDN